MRHGKRVGTFISRAALSGATLALLVAPPALRFALAEPATTEPEVAARTNAPTIEAMDIALIYAKLAGVTPDFRPYAEKTAIYRNATSFDRDQVLTREIGRLEAVFANLNTGQPYTIRVGAPILQWDAAQHGFPLQFAQNSAVPFYDPANGAAYGLSFRNTGAVNVIAFDGEPQARAFAQKFGLNMQYPVAGQASLELVFKIVEAPPSISAGTTPVRADILAARIVDGEGRVMRDFGQILDPGQSVAVQGPTPLKASDLQGIRLGMEATEAEGVAKRTYAAGHAGPGEADYYSGLTGGRPPMPCAITRRDMTATGLFATWDSCLTIAIPNGKVASVVSVQNLGNADAAATKQSLIEKFGTPTEDRGTVLGWVGRDPFASDGSVVEIVSTLAREANGLRLQIELKPYVDRKKPAPAVASVAPKL